MGIRATAGIGAGGGTATRAVGLWIDDIGGAATNYAIRTGLGQVDFGDSVNTSVGYRIGGAAPLGHCLGGNGTNYVDSTTCGGTGAAFIGSGLISGGGIVWTANLDFTVSAAQYYIAGTTYSSPQTDITLTAANGANPRIDVIAVDNTGTVIKIDGTAAPSPSEPSVDPTTQLKLGIIYVPASSATPANFSTVDIYLENTEWTTVRSPATDPPWALASTNNPFAGTKDIEASSAAAGNYVTFTKPAAGTENLANYATLSFRIRSKAAWASAKGITFTWLNGTTQVGLPVTMKSGTFGFTSSVTGSYQLVVLPVSLFNTGSNLVTTLKATVSGGGGSIGFYLDNVLLQTAQDGASAPTVNFVDGEVPSGAINSANQVYTIQHIPNPTTSLKCYGNGLRFKITADYTYAISVTTGLPTITTVGTFQTGDQGLVCDYRF